MPARSIAASPDGVVALLQGDGRRLLLGDATFELATEARHLAFQDDYLAVYGVDGSLLSFDAAGRRVGRLTGQAGALDMAVTPGGSVLLSFPDFLVRLGEKEERFPFPGGALAVEPGGVWIAGESKALRLRPGREGYMTLEERALPSAARAAGIGPDGALCVLLDAGRTLLVGAATIELDEELTDIARDGGRLLGAGPDGVVDLTEHVPRPVGDGPAFNLPSCS